jgi:hypothetical protein
MQSLAALKQLACHLEVDNNGHDGGPTNTFKDDELDTTVDPLQIIMGAFPNVDPANVVMAMQVIIIHGSSLLSTSFDACIA